MGSDSIAAVYFVEVPGSSEQANAKWLDLVHRRNYTDIRPWYQEGAKSLQLVEVRKQIKRLQQELWDRIERAHRAEAAHRATCAGRRPSSSAVSRNCSTCTIISALVRSAWSRRCMAWAGKAKPNSPLPTPTPSPGVPSRPVGACGPRARRNFSLSSANWRSPRSWAIHLSDAEKNDPVLLGKAVLNHLKSRADAVRDVDPAKVAAALLLLDNISEPGLLAPSQIATLPQANWLQLIATTRLGPDQLSANPKSLALFGS